MAGTVRGVTAEDAPSRAGVHEGIEGWINLIIRQLNPVVDQDAITLDTFEFLDMDAY